MMLYNLALRITGSFAASVMTIVFFFFRSALTFFHFVLEHLQAGDLMETFRNNMNFIGYTPNENWGLWNFNVYLNQRHLAFGLLIVTLALWMFLDWVDAGCAHEEKGWNWLTGRIFSREAWKSLNGRYDAGADFFLEWSGCDRRTSDPVWICGVLRRKA